MSRPPLPDIMGGAKIMEIIEGTTQVHEDLLARFTWGKPARCAEDPNSVIHDHPHLTCSHSRRTRADRRVQSTEAEFPDTVTLNQLIEAQFARHPSRTALLCDHDKTFGTTSLSNARGQCEGQSIGASPAGGGCPSGKHCRLDGRAVLCHGHRDPRDRQGGGAYLPLPPDNPPDRTEYMLKDGGVAVLLVHGKTAGRTAFRGTIIDLDDPSLYRGSEANPVHINKPEDLAYVIYTSGSTGRPKGVMIEHRAVINRLHWMQRAYPIGERDVILQKTPLLFRCVGVGTVLVGTGGREALLSGAGG